MLDPTHRPAGRRRLQRILYRVPALLIALRFLLGPLLFLDARAGVTGAWFIVGLVLAALSDIFDGVIARRLGVATARLREADGRTDVWLYGWIAASVWSTHPDLVIAYRVPMLVMIGSQALAWAVDWIKYRRFSNYHAYTARIWGATLFVLTIALFGFHSAGVFLWLAVATGLICTLEEIAMTLILPHWIHDVPSVLHALRLRAEEP